MLKKTPGATTGDMARELKVTGSAMKHCLERMEAKGLVKHGKRVMYRQGGSSPVNHWFLSTQKGFQP